MTTAIDMLAPHLFLVCDSVTDKNVEFVSIEMFAKLIDDTSFTKHNGARTLRKCIERLFDWAKPPVGDPVGEVSDYIDGGLYLALGIAEVTRHALFRRDIFDLLVLTGPHKMFTWTPARICYISHFYPCHPIPGVSFGLPCKDLQQHANVIGLFTKVPVPGGTIPDSTG
jgi:hypothetical protein